MRLSKDMSASVRESSGAQAPNGPNLKIKRVNHLGQVRASPYLRAAVICLILAGTPIAIWRLVFYESELDKGIAALKQAFPHKRPFLSRTTLFGYGRFDETRGPAAGVDAAKFERARELIHRGSSTSDPQGSHALGALYMAQGNLDLALALLRSALNARPRDAKLHNDLGAAILEKAIQDREKTESGAEIRDKSVQEFNESLSHFRLALELDDKVDDSRFNRALCHELMDLPERAREDWLQYLERDRNSGWANEARQRVEQLERRTSNSQPTAEQLLGDYVDAFNTKTPERAWQILVQYRDVSGGVVEYAVIDRYSRHKVERRNTGGAADIDPLLYGGDVVREKSGDVFLYDLARWHQHATAGDEAARRKSRDLMEHADSLFIDQNKFREASGPYQEAAAGFRRIGDECEAILAEYRVAHCYIRQSLRVTDGLQMLESLEPAVEARGYKWLAAQCLIGLADGYLSQREYSKAIDHSSHAVAILESYGDHNCLTKAFSQLGLEHQFVGKDPESLAFYERAMNEARAPGVQPRTKWGIYAGIAPTCDSLGLNDIALDYDAEALRLVLGMNSQPLLTSRSYANVALGLGRLRDFGEARKNALVSYDIGERFPDKDTGKNIMAYSAMARGQIALSAGEFTDAISSFDLSIKLYGEINQPAYELESHKGRFFALVAEQADEKAKVELAEALSLFEGMRRRIKEESSRDAFFGASQDIYDIAIDFRYSKDSDEAALNLAEDSRARSFLDLINSAGELEDTPEGPDLILQPTIRPRPVKDLRQAIPNEAQILEYSVLRNRLIIWVISKAGLWSKTVDISESSLNDKVHRFLDYIASSGEDPNAEWDALGKALYGILIGPVESHLAKKTELCIVADKSLSYLPFQALRSSSGTCLLEDHAITYSPSANIYVACSKAAASRTRRVDEQLLMVAAPSFDSDAFPNLSPLDAAKDEAQNIRTYYPESTPLIGRSCRKQAVVSQMPGADVIEFATHCITDPMSAMNTKLLLAREPGVPLVDQSAASTLRAHEIYGMKLPKTQLVVLSSCQTAIEKCYRGEGAVGMARPFIVAQVPVVVASLWPVESASTTLLLTDFHRLRKLGGLSTAAALRQAELDLLRSRNGRFQSPKYWAAFTAVGGTQWNPRSEGDR